MVAGNIRYRFCADMEVLIKRQRRHRNRYPTSDAALRQPFAVDNAGRTGGDDTVKGLVVNQQFGLGFPTGGILYFVQEERHPLSFPVECFVIQPQDVAQGNQFEQRVVKTQVENASRVFAALDQVNGDLPKYRGLAHPART